MPPLSELDANLSLPSGAKHRHPGYLVKRVERGANVLRVKVISQDAASKSSEPVNKTDAQIGLDKVSDFAPVKVWTFDCLDFAYSLLLRT